MHLHRRAIEPRHPRHQSLRSSRVLHRAPDLGPVRPDIGKTVRRLHGRVGQEGDLVSRLDRPRRSGQRGSDIAVVPDRLARALDRCEHARAQGLGVDYRLIGHGLPACDQRALALHRRPGRVGHDCHALPEMQGTRLRLDPDDPAHAGDPLRARGVEPGQPMPEGRMQHAGVQHAGRTGVHAVACAPGDDPGVLHSRHPRAHEPIARGILARRLGRDGAAGGVRRERAVVGPAAARRMLDDAVGGGAVLRCHAPARRRRLDQHPPGDGARGPERLPVVADPGAAAGELVAESRLVEIALDHPDPFPGHVELFGDDQWQRGLHALADLRILGDDRDPAVRSDLDEGAKRRTGYRRSRSGRGGEGAAQPARQGDGHQEPARGGGTRLHEFAAAHHVVSSAARWIADRMRWYVPQRQRLPESASSICASVGRGVARSSAAAAMI